MANLTKLPQWQALLKHQRKIAGLSMRAEFACDPHRFSKFSLETAGILFDYSKNRITTETMALLTELADGVNLAAKREALFNGWPINTTEYRPALHTALRNSSDQPVMVDAQDIMPEIRALQQKMRILVEQVHQGQRRGVTGETIRHIVNIGIGGSDLGPKMAVQALQDYAKNSLRCHFISNVDNAHLTETLQQIEPASTLFIISSKSFSTIETLTNAQTIRQWLQQRLAREDVTAHFAAVTAAPEKALEFGIARDSIFPMWDWVGGRYSVWSAVGLPLALMIGMDNFSQFLAGAREVDLHFLTNEWSMNIPVLMALLSVWYVNFFDARAQAIIPYSHRLNYLPAYLQQAEMESNGKSVTQENNAADYATGFVLFGEQGCNGQHAYHQLLHQGQQLIPADFILVGQANRHEHKSQHDLLIASALSQAQALMQGKTWEEACQELLEDEYEPDEAERLASHKLIPGNRPSNTLFLDKLTPHSLGALLALYEHKIFVEGVIWNINSFDQWGVELGKQLLPSILSHLQGQDAELPLDVSTQGLIARYHQSRGQ